jgi:hypothetical protein
MRTFFRFSNSLKIFMSCGVRATVDDGGAM